MQHGIFKGPAFDIQPRKGFSYAVVFEELVKRTYGGAVRDQGAGALLKNIFDGRTDDCRGVIFASSGVAAEENWGFNRTSEYFAIRRPERIHDGKISGRMTVI